MLGVALRVNNTYTHKEMNIKTRNLLDFKDCATKVPFNQYLMEGIPYAKGNTI